MTPDHLSWRAGMQALRWCSPAGRAASPTQAGSMYHGVTQARPRRGVPLGLPPEGAGGGPAEAPRTFWGARPHSSPSSHPAQAQGREEGDCEPQLCATILSWV